MLMNTDRFIVYIQAKDVYKDIANDFEKRFDTSNWVIERLLPKGRNKKRIGLMKDELGGKMMAELVELRPKTCSYLIDDGGGEGTKKCVTK